MSPYYSIINGLTVKKKKNHIAIFWACGGGLRNIYFICIFYSIFSKIKKISLQKLNTYPACSKLADKTLAN
jgi:hypothetical protein